jgi:succinate dehydrogenase / fumarate reductase membrane anchor subunit
MVTAVTSLTGNGLKDWLFQRISALFLLIYIGWVVGYMAYHPHMGYVEWQAFFHCAVMRAATVIAVLMLVIHAWIGIWTVTTDYLTCTVLRLSAQIGTLFYLLAQMLWVVMIVWGQ